MNRARILTLGLVAGAAAGFVPPAGAAHAAPADAAAAHAAPATWTRGSDFDGDGFDDLAIGAPGGEVGGVAGAGYVTIVPGSRKGADPGRATVLSQATEGVPGEPGRYRGFGEALAAADLNADGFADLVVGTPQDSDDPEQQFGRPGSLTVFFGSAGGLGRAQRVLGNGGLGTAVTAADMDGDGRPEIVAAEPPSNFGKLVRFTVATGAYAAERTADTAVYGRSALAAGDVDGDGYEDVVALYTQVGGSNSFAVHRGSPTGLRPEAAHDNVYNGGADVAVGDLNRDGRADVVIGDPVDRWTESVGQVNVFYGAAGAALPEEPDLVLDQDSAGVPDTKEPYDWFGSSVALGDLTGDGHPELVVGAQREGTGTDNAVKGAGSVSILLGSATGLSGKAQWLARGERNLPGTPEANDQFGWLGAVRDLNGDGRGDLAVSATGRNASADYPYYGDGFVTVLPGRAWGVAAKKAVTITPGAVGAPATAARFGWSLGR